MSNPSDISPAIIETLYEEAIDLAEQARSAFEGWSRLDGMSGDGDKARVAMSCEALRTTTRMMHGLAWLLNQRAYFRGEMSQFALRRHGRLPAAQPDSSPSELALLAPEMQAIVHRTHAFYSRIQRLDTAWREHFVMQPSAVHRLRERLGASLRASSR